MPVSSLNPLISKGFTLVPVGIGLTGADNSNRPS